MRREPIRFREAILIGSTDAITRNFGPIKPGQLVVVKHVAFYAETGGDNDFALRIEAQGTELPIVPYSTIADEAGQQWLVDHNVLEGDTLQAYCLPGAGAGVVEFSVSGWLYDCEGGPWDWSHVK